VYSFVILEVVVLHVERHLGAARELHPGVEREQAERHQAEPGDLGRRHRALGDAAERRLGAERNRFAGDRLAVDGGQRGAGAESQHGREQQARAGEPAPGRVIHAHMRRAVVHRVNPA
jgi:hypothetical protein